MQFVFISILALSSIGFAGSIPANRGQLTPGKYQFTGQIELKGKQIVFKPLRGTNSEWQFELRSKDPRLLLKALNFKGLPLNVTGWVLPKKLGMRRHLLQLESISFDKSLNLRPSHSF